LVNDLYYDFFNGGEGVHPGAANSPSYSSLKEYFRSQSDGQFTPEFTIIGPITLSKSYQHYGKDSSGGAHDINISDFYSEACKIAVQKYNVNWSDFDANSNSIVDFVMFIYAGEGQNGCADPYTIWPKESTSSLTVNYYDADSVKTTVRFGSYGCTNELFGGIQDGIGVCLHEFCHGLGLPDFYDTNYSAFGLDYWDLMDAGCYQIDGHYPIGLSAYELDFMGWRELVTLDPDSAYTLTLDPLATGGVAYKVVNKANPDEYFILENRQNIGYDAYMACKEKKHITQYGIPHGLMITHVDYNKASWTGNRVNTQYSHQRITITPADGKLVSSIYGFNSAWAQSLRGDLYPGPDNVTEITSYDVFTGDSLAQTIDHIQETATGTIIVDINGGVHESNPYDLTGDGKLTIEDITVLINYYLTGEW
jgi:M6 family metalloprotease-like protein